MECKTVSPGDEEAIEIVPFRKKITVLGTKERAVARRRKTRANIDWRSATLKLRAARVLVDSSKVYEK
jgi:hypothetical protein